MLARDQTTKLATINATSTVTTSACFRCLLHA